MRVNRGALLMALALTVIMLAIPATRSLPVALLACVVLAEWGVTEYSLAQLRRESGQATARAFIAVTMVLAIIVAVVLRSPAFMIALTTLLIVLSALLRTPRTAVVPGAIGFIAFCGLTLAEHQGWRSAIQIQDLSPAALVINSGFVGAALSIIIAISMVTAGRFRQSVRAAHARAGEAEQERRAQEQLANELARRVDEQHRLLSVIRELEIPVMPVAHGVVVLPIIGHVDEDRARRIEQRLLDVVTQQRASLAVVDLTGMPILDAAGVRWVLQLAQAVRLVGSEAILSGISPDSAQTFAQVEGGVRGVTTVATLADALERALHESNGS